MRRTIFDTLDALQKLGLPSKFYTTVVRSVPAGYRDNDGEVWRDGRRVMTAPSGCGVSGEIWLLTTPVIVEDD